MKIIVFLVLVALEVEAVRCDYADGHYYWLVGNPADFVVPVPSALTGGVVLAGGGGYPDSAMRWFLRKAAGGDVVVFRNAENGLMWFFICKQNYLFFFIIFKVRLILMIQMPMF